jgi:hypothetical protein
VLYGIEASQPAIAQTKLLDGVERKFARVV